MLKNRLLYFEKWNFACLILLSKKIKPKTIKVALDHADWFKSMHE